MKRFRFELEKALELREYRERETKIELGKAVSVLTGIEQNIAAVTGERERIMGTTTADIFSFDRYILRLDKTKETLAAEAVQAEHKVAEAREIYLEASRDRKVLDKVKERRRREYRTALAAEETKILDDLSGGVKARKTAMGAL